MSRPSKRRHEQRRRHQRPRPRHQQPEAVPSLDDVSAAAFAAASGLADEPEPAVAEAFASSLFAQWMGAELKDADPVLVLGSGMVDFLARDASPDALALLAALSAVDPMVIELDCARAMRRLVDAGARQAAVDEFEPAYREAVRDPARAGPAKSIAALMMSDGVDLTDTEAAQDWIDAFNGRPQDERIRLTRWPGS